LAGPQIDISAQTQSAEASLRRLTDAFNRLGQAAAQSTRQKFRVLDPEDLGAASQLEEKLRQIMHMHPSIRTAVRATGQNPAAPASVNWQNVPLTPGQVRTLMQHMGGGGNRFSRPGGDDPVDVNRFGEGIARAMGRFFGGVGGGGGQIGGAAAGGAMGGGGMGGLLRGGLVGAGLFGAFKAGQAITEGYDSAKLLATEMDHLKRRMGDIGVSFDALMNAADLASHGLEINSSEAGKLMSEFNKLSGGVKDTADLAAGTRTGVGLAKAMGLDPSSGVGFLANMRNITRGGSGDGDRKLALMIGDVVTRSGMNARADDVLQAVQQFAQATSRISLTGPNVGGFGGMYAGMLAARIPGLTPENAAAMLGQANSAMMNMGAFGEASETFTLSALGRYGSLNPIQARVLSEGGLFGTRAGSFGAGSMYRRYAGDAAADELMGGANGGVTNFEAVRKQLDSMNVHPDIKAEMAKNFFGLSSISQAMAMLSINPEEMGKTQALLGSRGINLQDYNESGITTLSGIANAGSMGGLRGIASDMMGRTGKGALSSDERAKLAAAVEEANRIGGSEGFKKLQDVLTDLAADKNKQETVGSQMLDQQKRIETAMTNVGKELLGPITTMKEALMVMTGMGAGKLRDKAATLERSDVNSDIDARIKKVNEDFSADVAKIPGPRDFFGNPVMTPEFKQRHDELKKERDAKMVELEAERRKRIEAINQSQQRDQEAANIQSGLVGGSVGERNASRLSRVTLTEEEERTIQDVSGGDPAKASFLRNVLKIENRGNSRVNNNAVSPAGARGAFQFMPKTASTFASRLGMDSYDLSNFGDSAKLASAYYDDLRTRYRGNRAKMYADYNGGPRLAANAGATGNRENDDYVAMGLHLDRAGQSTPLPMADPLGRMMANNSAQPYPVMINGEFRLLDERDKNIAAPFSITKKLGVPASAGSF
jgi:hypothetical protein